MYCSNCGTQLPEAARYCMNCGTPTSDSKAQQRIEFKEEYIDLRHLRIFVSSSARTEKDAAWGAASASVLKVISEFGNQGWELVEANVGFDQLVMKNAGATGTGILLNFMSGLFGESADAAQVIGARLHFKRKL